MLEYLLRLAVLLPLLAGLIWGSLWLTRWLQTRLHSAPGAGGARRLQLVETSLIAPGMKLAVVRFHDREILLGCTRQGMVRLGEVNLGEADLGEVDLSEVNLGGAPATAAFAALPENA